MITWLYQIRTGCLPGQVACLVLDACYSSHPVISLSRPGLLRLREHDDPTETKCFHGFSSDSLSLRGVKGEQGPLSES